MSGHSKWHNIKIRKGKQDEQKGKLFGKLAREIIVAARHGGGDIDGNPRLRLAVQHAREASMPNDNIDRAVKRGTGELDGVEYEEIVYEGYGPGGVAVFVEALTDNRNRTVADLRHIFAKNGGSMGENGCVAWIFERKGIFAVDKDAVEEDTLMELALEAGADDVAVQDDGYEIICAQAVFADMRAALDEDEVPVRLAELTMIPSTTMQIDGNDAHKMLRLMEALEDNDDVQRVSANFDIPDEILEEHNADPSVRG